MKKINQILLIEDNRATSYFNRLIIEEMNICDSVEVAWDGKEGINYLTNTQNLPDHKLGYPCPDLILLDLNMHGMDGYDFLNSYKTLTEKQKGNSIIIVLTSSQLNIEKEKVAEYVFVKDFINKPLKEEGLLALIEKYF